MNASNPSTHNPANLRWWAGLAAVSPSPRLRVALLPTLSFPTVKFVQETVVFLPLSTGTKAF